MNTTENEEFVERIRECVRCPTRLRIGDLYLGNEGLLCPECAGKMKRDEISEHLKERRNKS